VTLVECNRVGLLRVWKREDHYTGFTNAVVRDLCSLARYMNE
jgi:hypothetical protein